MDDDPVALCLAGLISPAIALWRLASRGLDPALISAAVRRADPAECSGLARFVAAHAPKAAALHTLLSEAGDPHERRASDPESEVQRITAFFDRTGVSAPDASVAAYTLADADLACAATQEIMDFLSAISATGLRVDALDFGCGVGRLTAELDRCCRSVLGLDISAAMIAEARRRHPALRFGIAPGATPPALKPSSFDLVLACDVFPYLVQAGGEIAGAHIAAFARAVRPTGLIVILNLSYRGDATADRADARRWAADHDLALERTGDRPFVLWDAAAFVLRVTPRGG